ncbi:MAG: uroporphyrinogen decarboxylase family protein [Thermoguttaceae bacterium]|jgi:uroporphyrinogen-III decarboxylase
MSAATETLYAQRLERYVTAMRNGKPDRVPIRPFVAELTAKYAGYTIQEVTQDYQKAFAAARKCAADFDWDAVVGNMVYGWAGLVQAIGLKYYASPGVELPPDTPFQYLEPPEDQAWMQPDDYDALAADPTGYLLNVWLPRVSTDVSPTGQPTSMRNNLSFLKGGMAMLQYFQGFGTQAARLRSESGTVSAICGILKAPLDILADKLRGYKGLCADLFRRPEKVLAACEALAPHLLEVAASGADPEKNVPIGLWMHRGCVPFLSPPQFEKFYWPTLRWIVEGLWARGHQTLFYAEGDWTASLRYFAELPERSIVFHVDRSDPLAAHRTLGDKFCISGGVPNDLLAFGTPEEVRACCKRLLDGVAREGGYIMDASAIMQDDTKIENLRAMTDFTREYGVY